MSNLSDRVRQTCFHCGSDCLTEEAIEAHEQVFCCRACLMVHELLLEKNLCGYYDLREGAIVNTPKEVLADRFYFLEEDRIVKELIDYRDKDFEQIRLHLPTMHCSACIWLLEQFNRIDPGVLQSEVDFIRKELLLRYRRDQTNLKYIVEKLCLIGYEPELNIALLNRSRNVDPARKRRYRIGVAGFITGNTMLLSFPEYFNDATLSLGPLDRVFPWINLILSIPLFFFCASEFTLSAWKSVRRWELNIDVPIAIGIIAMFTRSIWEVLSQSGPGYFDSMSGLVFFMLVGRQFQDKTFQWLRFERDYTSYFPLALSRIVQGKTEIVPVQDIREGDHLYIRVSEIIPSDATLMSESAEIDYSFVTGESTPQSVARGQDIFAGGRVSGQPAEVLMRRPVDSSYLNRLWNREGSGTPVSSRFSNLVSVISKWFIVITLVIACSAFLYWLPGDRERAMKAFIAVLVIACPCALALSAPFTFGNMIRILSRQGLYLKNARVIEKLADCNHLVFDKTGTLSDSGAGEISFTGSEPDEVLQKEIFSLAMCSTHPLSRAIARFMGGTGLPIEVKSVDEIAGFGIRAFFGQRKIELRRPALPSGSDRLTSVELWVNDEPVGTFFFNSAYRPGTTKLSQELNAGNWPMTVLSGDNSAEKEKLQQIFGSEVDLHFHLSPTQKAEKIIELQKGDTKVLMTGDGLNDSGALKEAHVGLSITDSISSFSPASDGIVLANGLEKIPALLRYSKSGIRIIIVSFILSLGYNFIGLAYAVQGELNPLIAAILMPISTSSLVAFTVLASNLKARRLGLHDLNQVQKPLTSVAMPTFQDSFAHS